MKRKYTPKKEKYILAFPFYFHIISLSKFLILAQLSTSYTDLVNVPSFGKKRENNFNPERGEIAFFCRDCWKGVEPIALEPQKIWKKIREYLYECPVCHGKRIAIGTVEGLKEHYERKH